MHDLEGVTRQKMTSSKQRKTKLVTELNEGSTQPETPTNQSNDTRNATIVSSCQLKAVGGGKVTEGSPTNSSTAIKPFTEAGETSINYKATEPTAETCKTPKSLTEMVTISSKLYKKDCEELVCGHINTNCHIYKDKTTTLSTNSYNFVIN